MLISIKYIFSQKIQNKKKELEKEHSSQYNITIMEVSIYTIKLL